MIIKELTTKKMFKEFSIEIPYEDINISIENKIKEIIPTITLPGFRKGKAPLNIVRKKYENNILTEVIEKIIQKNTKLLLDEKKLKPLRQPKVEIARFKKNEPVELNLKIDLQPKFNLVDFTKAKSKKYKINIDKLTYENNYNNYIKSQKNYLKIIDNRPIIKGDKVIVNIKSKNEIVPDFLRDQKNIPLITDSDYQILPNISDELIKKRVKTGDNIKMFFDIKDFLKEKNKTLAEFEIEIKLIEEQKPLIINKEFLKQNNFASEKDFRDKINDNLKNYYDDNLKEIEKKQIFDLLESSHEFDLPERIFDEEFNQIWQKVKKAKQNNTLDQDDKKLSDTKLEKRYRKIAARRVKTAIIMQTIAEQNTIDVSKGEMTDGLLSYASQYPGQEKQIFDFFKNNPVKMESIRGPIFENKILEYILTKTKKENQTISVKDLKKLQESTFSFKEKD